MISTGMNGRSFNSQKSIRTYRVRPVFPALRSFCDMSQFEILAPELTSLERGQREPHFQLAGAMLSGSIVAWQKRLCANGQQMQRQPKSVLLRRLYPHWIRQAIQRQRQRVVTSFSRACPVPRPRLLLARCAPRFARLDKFAFALQRSLLLSSLCSG